MRKAQIFKKILAYLLAAVVCAGAVSLAGCGGRQPKPLENCPVLRDDEFGGVYIQMTIDDFNKLGYSYGDSVNISFSNGYSLEGIPYYSGYYSRNGQPLLVAYPGYPYIKACINNGDPLWDLSEVSEGDTATVTLAEKDYFLAIQNARNLRYLNDREKFPSDEVFANFRPVSVTGMKENILYRSASPCDNQYNRVPYVDALMEKAAVDTVIDLADTEAKIEGYLSAGSPCSPYFLSLYESGLVFPIGMNTNFGSDGFKAKVLQVVDAIVNNEGPYLVHCTEGKDRTGFICMLLEAFCGASYKEIVTDYMITYDNYYQINLNNQRDKYDVIVHDILDPMILFVAGDENTDLETADLSELAERYLERIGVSLGQLGALSEKLSSRQ
ncbi:MAG: tyrosine-protein phosphatase [Clostridia bacterium]|nr:tyrosine-protein phosphatase [Clostridia bacterium]